jgi:hypothetical protein
MGMQRYFLKENVTFSNLYSQNRFLNILKNLPITMLIKGEKMKDYHAVFLACLLAAITIVSGPASGLHISGSIWQEDVTPGEKAIKEINISIDSKDKPTNFTIEVVGMEQTLEGLNIPASEENNTAPYNAMPLLTVSPMSFHLEPGGSQLVIAKADIPNNVGSGTRYAIIAVKTKNAVLPNSKKGESNVGVSIGSNIPVILSIADSEMEETGEITDIKKEEISAKQQNISVILKNTGNTHYKAKAIAELISTKGNIMAQAETPVSFSSIVPTFSRLFEISLTASSKLDSGTYNLTVTIEKKDGTVLDKKETTIKV